MFGIFKKNKPSPRPVEHEQLTHQRTSVPADVIAFLNLREELNTPELGIHILNEETSALMSSSMQSIGVGKHLGLIVLDDANDSNPYCYITEGVTAGMVVHFNHDPEPRIEFDSLHAFEAFLRHLRSHHLEMGGAELETPAHPDQAALAAELLTLTQASDEDSEFLICLYLPLLRGKHQPTLEALSVHESFFVREAVAEVIGAALLPESGPALLRLTADIHPQVRNAAIKASKMLKHANHGT